MVDRKRRPNVVWMIPLFIFMGLLEFYSVTKRPGFELYRTLDIVQLLASGGLFGVAVGVAMLARTRHHTTGRVVVIQQELDRILADTTAASVGTSGALSTSAVTVDRPRLLQLRERLEALLAAPYRR
jgi:hypothetical protein